MTGKWSLTKPKLESMKDLKGIETAKRDLKRSISRLRTKVRILEELLEAEEWGEDFVTYARIVGEEVSHTISAASQLRTLLWVVDGTYVDPKEELQLVAAGLAHAFSKEELEASGLPFQTISSEVVEKPDLSKPPWEDDQ